MRTGEILSAPVSEESEGWNIASKTSPDSPKEAAVNDVNEYRGYDIEDEKVVLTFVTELCGAMDELRDVK